MRPTRSLCLAAFAALSAAPGVAGCEKDSAGPAPASALERTLADARGAASLPAVAAAVVEGDSVRAAAQGVRRADRSARAAAGDRFHVGSMAKAVSATVIATVVEEGRLAWTTRVRDAWPEEAQAFHPALRDVTLAELLAHRGGLEPFDAVDAYAGFPASARGAPALREEFAAWVLRRPPGARGEFRYSNAGYVVAAAMAERATGKPFETLLRERLFGPLGMGTAAFAYPSSLSPDAPWGHLPDGSRWVPEPAPDGEYAALLATIVPAGHLSLSMEDYARFLRMHLRGLAGQGGLPLRPETFRVLHTPVGAPIPDLNGGYALGWIVMDVDGVRVSMHDGSLTGFYATMALAPGLGRAAVAATNADPSGPGVPQALEAVIRALVRRE